MTRPLGVGALLDAAVRLVREHFVALIVVTLVVCVPVELLRGIITAATTDFCRGIGCQTSFGTDATSTYDDVNTYVGGQALIVVLTVLQYLVVQIGCFRIVAEGCAGRRTSPGESIRFALSRGRSVLALSFLVVVIELVGFLFLIVPGVWLAVALSVAVPALLVERITAPVALSRSFELVKGRWWATFGRLALSYLLITIAAGLLSALVAVPLLLLVDAASYGGLVATGLVNLISTVLTAPFIAAVTMLVYFDLRVRKEGALPAELTGDTGAQPAVPTPPDAFGHTATVPAPRVPEPPVYWGPPTEAPPADDPAAEEPESDPPPRDFDGWAPPRPG